jgi:hypothetical protein
MREIVDRGERFFGRKEMPPLLGRHFFGKGFLSENHLHDEAKRADRKGFHLHGFYLHLRSDMNRHERGGLANSKNFSI